MRRKKLWKTVFAASLSAAMVMSAAGMVCAEETEIQNTTVEDAADSVQTGESSIETQSVADSASTEENGENTAEAEAAAGETVITLSDEEILIDGQAISSDSSAAVYAGADIVYYKEGQDAVYGAGDESDGHSEEEAAEHTVITITQPGTYRVTGTISKGQIAVDLGEDSREDENARVTLILDQADITCAVAPAIVVYNAYECGSDDTDTASKDVDTSNAGFCLVLADGSENSVNGSHVAKIYKEGTTQEEVDAGEAKKAWKFDAAIDSLVSFRVDGETEGSGKLTVTSDNEGMESALHMTLNGGNLTINSADDALNASEDSVSVLTINGGTVICNAGAGQEGDGIDSNGWIVINDGYVVASANGNSQDSGVDSDLGIYINGGTLLAGGNMYDEVSGESGQTFTVLSFQDKLEGGQLLMLKDSTGTPVTAFSLDNSCQTIVYSDNLLMEGDYTLYQVSSVEGDCSGGIYTNITSYQEEAQLEYSSTFLMGPGGQMGFGGFPGGPSGDGNFPGGNGEAPEGMEDGQPPELPEGMTEGQRPELPEGAEAGELPEGMEEGQRPELPEGAEAGELPEGMEEGQRPELPEGAEAGELPEGMEKGQRPELPEGAGGGEMSEPDTVFSITGIQNVFAQISLMEGASEEA